MSRVSGPVVPGAFTAPTMDPGAFVISRAEEGQRIAAYIREASKKLVVLCGQPASGKTMLVKQWVVPALQRETAAQGYRIFVGECASQLPTRVTGEDGEAPLDDVMARKSIVVLDAFDTVFEASRDERHRELDALFTKLNAAHDDAILVLIVTARHLTNVYELASYDPSIASAVYQVRSIDIADGIRQLDHDTPSERAQVAEDIYLALQDEWKRFERRGLEVTFALLRLLHSTFVRERLKAGQARFSFTQYKELGGIAGILRDHVDRTLEQLQPPDSSRLARAILQLVREAQIRGEPPDFGELEYRFEVDQDRLRGVIWGLTGTDGLLRWTPDKQFEFEPPQIVAILEDDAVARQQQLDRLVRIVEEGLRSWQSLGGYLTPVRFAEVHSKRHYLVLEDDLTRFVATCAVRHELSEGIAVARYWLRRVRMRADAVAILLPASLDENEAVRERAVTLLGEYKDPPDVDPKLVRDRLCDVVLMDPSSTVRAGARASLRDMSDDRLLERVLVEVRSSTSLWRENAIDALACFRQGSVTTELKSIVDSNADVGLRARAVSVLAALDSEQSVDTLVEIALRDPDAEDRQSAATALASVSTVELNRHLLRRLDWPKPTLRIVLVLLAVTVGVITGFGYVFGSLMTDADSWLRPEILGLIFLGLLVLQLPLGIVLPKLREGQLRWRSPAGTFAHVVFWASAIVVLPYVHGLAHALSRRWKPAFLLFGLELLGLLFVFFADDIEFVPRWGQSVATLYSVLGYTLFIGSYLYDVIGVSLRVFLLVKEERRSHIYRSVFKNPAMQNAVFADLQSVMSDDATRAQKLLRAYGACIPRPQLVEMFVAADPQRDRYVIDALKRTKDEAVIAQVVGLWDKGPADRRAAIVSVLERRPTDASVAALRRLTSKSGIALKLRTGIAGLRVLSTVRSWPARLALVAALPLAFVLVYHVVMARQNPAWALIVLLNQPLTRSAQQVKIVNFLADAYPRESLEALRGMFQKRSDGYVSTVDEAVARGMVTIHDSLSDPDSYEPTPGLVSNLNELRADLLLHFPRFAALLPDSAGFQSERALEILRHGAAARDSILSRSAIRHLVDFSGTGAISSEKNRVVAALAGLDYARALPALDRVLTNRRALQRSDWSKLDSLILTHHIDSIALHRYRSIPPHSRESDSLRKVIASLAYKPNVVVQQLAQENTRSCDRNADDVCDAIDEALGIIATRPGSEDGYLDLYLHYGEDYTGAAAEFARLAKRHPRSIWPLKYLAFVYHEYLPKTDSSAFAMSYRYFAALRQLPAFRDIEREGGPNYVRMQSDYVEVALTAGQYREAERYARELLRDDSLSTTRYNMTLFLYMASVMQSQSDSATARLDELAQVIQSLPSDFYTSWIFDGTHVFVSQSTLPAELKDAIVALCKEGDWYSPKEALAVVERNRAALRLLPTGRVD